MNTHTDPDTGVESLFAETVSDTLALVKRAKLCLAHVIISDDIGIDVSVSKKAIRDALVSAVPDSPCGGILWLDDMTFRLDRAL